MYSPESIMNMRPKRKLGIAIETEINKDNLYDTSVINLHQNKLIIGDSAKLTWSYLISSQKTQDFHDTGKKLSRKNMAKYLQKITSSRTILF